MGANAQTSVPTFTAGEILTAANMNISARTGIPVFADSTARDAAFGGTGEKTLAEGQFAYLESTNVTQYYDGSTWQPVASASGLTLISTTTIGTAVSSVTVSNAFSSTYDSYKIIVSGGVASTTNSLNMTLGTTATGYYRAGFYNYYAVSTGARNGNNATSWVDSFYGTTKSLSGVCDLVAPNLAKETLYYSQGAYALSTEFAAYANGFLDNTTQYTAFTLTTSSGTVTGGTIRVYGYANS